MASCLLLHFLTAQRQRLQSAGRRFGMVVALLALGMGLLGAPARAQVFGGKIAFTSTRDNGWGQIYVMNPDGSNQTNLSNNFLNQHNNDYASFNRLGTKIVFISDRTGSWNVYTMNADGSSQTRLTNFLPPSETFFLWSPVFSPDGNKIAFTGRPASPVIGTSEVYIMNADGTGLTQLTSNSGGGDVAPAFTLDGSKILFQRFNPNAPNGSNMYDLWQMNADGSGQKLLFAGIGDAIPVAFRPDGVKIAYVGTDLVTNLPGSPFPGYDISLMNADGTGQTVLTTGGSSNLDPAFSPDGARIAFTSDRSQPACPGGPPSNPEIYVMNADGTNVVQLTFTTVTSSGQSWNAHPSWGPGAIGIPAVVSLALNPASVTGGNSAQGTVSLSGPAPSGGAIVALTSSVAGVGVPASVTVPEGSTGASFTVTTTPVTAATSAVITASYAGVSQAATLTVNPAQPADTVTITKAEYTISQKQLKLETTSTSLNATLTAYVTSSGALIGTLTNVGGGKYQLQTTWPTNPQNITVRSSLGGVATGAVTPHN